MIDPSVPIKFSIPGWVPIAVLGFIAGVFATIVVLFMRWWREDIFGK